MFFIPERVRRKISAPVYFMCFVAAVCLLIRLYPFEWAPACYEVKTRFILSNRVADAFNVPFCGKRICSVSGEWHIDWEIPATANFLLYNMDIVACFIMPFVYGSWKMTVYHIVNGPFLAHLTTSNPNEWAAVWCLYSIALVLLLIKSPIRNRLFVKHWFWWKWLKD